MFFIKIGNRLVGMICRDNPEGGGGGGNPTPKQPETFSREYVHELREENKSTRLKLQEAQTEAQRAKEEAEKVKREAQEQVTAATTSATEKANQRIIRAEMKAEAIKMGLSDLDDLQLVDISGVKIKEDGSIEGITETLTKFKEAKPHKFGQASSSDPGKPPKKDDDKTPKKVGDMTPEERKARARELGIKTR